MQPQARCSIRSNSFIAQLSDLCQLTLLHKDEAFCVLKRLLNFAPHKIESARRKHDAFLDYYLPDSTLECHRGHLLVDDYFVKVLTLKEPSSQSFPLIFKRLLEVEASFIICTEWHPEDGSKIQKSIQSRRRHYHNSKMSIFSQLAQSEASRPKDDFLVDDSKESLIQELGEANKEIVIHGHTFGEFSLTVVLYDRDLARIDHAISAFSKIFSTVDAVLIDERYNLLNAYLAVVPGNYQLNLRRMYLLNTNYADYSFFFTLHQGERENKHLGSEYLAVLESTHKTPYYLNLHHGDLAHTTILGKSGSGKSFLLNFLITFLQKYDPYTFIFDMGGSYRSLTEMFGGSYLQVGLQSQSFSINPFCLPPTRDNLNFLFAFVSLLIHDSGKHQLSHKEERDLFDQIEMMYSIDARLRTLSTLRNTLPDTLKEALHKWTQAGQLGFLFDNPEDTLTFSRFQCIEFEGMEKYPATHRTAALLPPSSSQRAHRGRSAHRRSEGLHRRRGLGILPQRDHQELHHPSSQDLAQEERRHDPGHSIGGRAEEVGHPEPDPRVLLDQDLSRQPGHGPRSLPGSVPSQ